MIALLCVPLSALIWLGLYTLGGWPWVIGTALLSLGVVVAS